MLLKSVEMQGFKSFADKIYLDFNPGITAIVGPNGSGKSNISDAIRWVMGEQSIKTLRGSKMEDVIFSGTQNRKPMGFAEVSLTLDNSKGFFPLDYEEITVTRRVYRSGEGEYFINRVGCRLKDIHELFMDTGLGREGYSIIGQGKIDEILSNKSEDRRQIFEEAAGITKYKYRKNEAERKLNHTTENLTRVKDIMAELENQIGPLFEQSEKAKKYLKIRDELKGIEVNLSVVKIDKLKADIEELTKNLTETDGEIDKIRSEVENNERLVNEIYADISSWDAQMEELREEEKRTIENIGDSNSKISVLLADISHYEENIKRLEETVNGYIIEAKDAENQFALLEEELEKFQTKCEEIKILKSNQESVISEIEKETQSKNSLVEGIKTDIIEKSSEINRIKERIANSEIFKQNFEERKITLAKELSEKAEDYNNLLKNVKEIEENLNKNKERLAKLEADRDFIAEEIDKKRTERTTLLEKSESVNTELNKKISKKNILEDMEKSLEGFSGSVRAVLSATPAEIGNAKIYGPFARLVKVSKEYTVAIDTALSNAGQNIVVENEEDAKRAIEYLKNKKSGRATFLPVSTVKERTLDVSKIKDMKGYIDIASNLVETDKKYSAIKSSLLGAIVIADNIDNATLIAKVADYKVKVVTLSGEVMQTGGAMTGGSFNKTAGFLSRDAEIKELATQIEALKEKLSACRDEANKSAEEIQKLSETLDFDNKEIAETSDDLIKAQADFTHYNAFLENVTAAKTHIENEISSIDLSIEKLDNEKTQLLENIVKTEEEIKTLEATVAGEQEGFESLIKKTREANDRLTEIIIEENSCEKDIMSQREKVLIASELIKSIAEKTELSEKEKQELVDKINKAKEEIESGKGQIDSLKTATKTAEETLKELAEKKAKAEEKTRILQKEITGTNDIMFGLSRQKAKIEGRKSGSETELENIFTRLWDEYELTYSTAYEIADKNADLSNAEKDIASLKAKIKNLGNINIDAIESYREIKERYDFLLAQTNDLEKAKADLEKIITEMLAVMKKQFAQQFEVINRSFNKVFAELFGGGFATLSLADPEDLLESGIEIEAQPPGKKLQRLSLLSGGERALTAIALLFAILNVRPTPFCILDEIEAALDDVNVNRYADYLKKYSEKSQFIVVTHRRGTMEAANILYGVTMQERGVSKLLSLNIDEVAK